MTKESVIISIDIEATGDAYSTSSCVMIGCAVLLDQDVNPNKKDWILEKKNWCIREVKPPEKRCWNEFWVNNQELWSYIQIHALPPAEAMKRFSKFYDEMTEKYKCRFVAAPASYDWMWVKCIYEEFGPEGKKPLPFSIDCFSTIKRLCYDLGFDRNLIQNITRHKSFEHTHYADDDALEQGYGYLKLTHWLKNNVGLIKK